jgi:hypothetical protein
VHAQKNEWIAPEGKILNYRTLNWADFMGKEDKDFAEKLAENNLRAKAYVCPAIYYYADSGKMQDNGRVSFRFRVKCAFQSRAFVRESTKQETTDYVLIHEQDHYDISMIYSNKLQAELSSKDYSEKNYNDEITKVYHGLMDKYEKTQELYDNEVNPEGRNDVEKQHLWDMRIKKCYENNTDEYLYASLSSVVSVKGAGQLVKRTPGEPVGIFATRCRPLYSWYTEEMAAKTIETTEWTNGKEVIAFYTLNSTVGGTSDLGSKEATRILACAFLPTGKDTYKRISIDTFFSDDKPAKITAVFYANADSDAAKELFILTTELVKNNISSGTLYTTHVYDNTPSRGFPARLQKLDDIAGKTGGGVEGSQNGKPSHPKCRNEKEVREALKKLGFG